MGMRNQALGLAEAIAAHPDCPACTIDARAVRASSLHMLAWQAGLPVGTLRWPGARPDLVICCGRRTAIAAAAAARQGIRVVFIGRPPKRLLGSLWRIIPSWHDGMTASTQVMPMLLSMNRLPVYRADSQAESTALAVLIGGNSRHTRYDHATCARLIEQLQQLHEQGWPLRITTSRRTPDILQAALVRLATEAKHTHPITLWHPQMHTPNPYPAMLLEAAAVVVTADSISMLSEAIACPAPTYVLNVPNRSARLQRFAEKIVADNLARPLSPATGGGGGGNAFLTIAQPTIMQNDTHAAAARIVQALKSM